MTSELIMALMGFAFVMSISPGPGNFLLLTSGANFGFLRSIPLLLGISAGFLSMVLLVGIGLGDVLEHNRGIYTVLRFACGVYVIWLAIQIARSRSLSSANADNIATPISFIQAALFQWVNPKAWSVSLIVTVAYTTADNDLTNLLQLILLFALVNIPTISIWALSGAALSNWLNVGNRIVFFNSFMALLLVAAMIPMLLSV